MRTMTTAENATLESVVFVLQVIGLRLLGKEGLTFYTAPYLQRTAARNKNSWTVGGAQNRKNLERIGFASDQVRWWFSSAIRQVTTPGGGSRRAWAH